MNVWMYVIREFEDAIADCKAGCIDCNDDPVHAWDEGVAFYAGSLEGTDGSGSGKMLHALADKRCKNFGTCKGTTHSSFVNEALFKEFTKGKVALQQGKCSEIAPIKKLIVELMSIPLVQGSLRYAYKVAKLQGGSKEFAEGAAFSAAILPRVHACDASAAKVISDNMNMEIAESARMSAGFGAVKKAFESVYECLGITCASVGGLILEGAEYYPGAEPCGTTSKGSCYNAKGDHSVECNVAEADCGGSYYAAGFVSSRSGCCHCKASCPMVSDKCTYYDPPKLIAGYLPGSDVTQHNLLDLDQAEMESHLKVPDYAKTKAIYTLGGNSGAKAEITVSALAADAAKGAAVKQGTVAVGKMKSAASAGATAITVSYTSSVCKEGGLDTKDVSGCFTVGGGAITIGGVNIGAPTAVSNKYRTLAGFSTAAEKKMTGQEYFDIYKAYFKVGDYAHQRVMAALDKTGICSACDDAPVHAWDEGVAFYTGSLEGTDGSGSGKMIYALADKRCKNFGTCTSAGGSEVNEELFKLFTRGKVALQQGKCDEAKPLKKSIVELMSVPLVQGSLRYAYKVANLQGGSKEFAEGAAFSAAILPRVHNCDTAAAKTISDTMNMEIDKSAWVSADTYPAVKKAFESTYACLGITCAHVGGLILDGTEYYEGAGPCEDAHEGHDHDATTTAAAIADRSIRMQSSSAIVLGVLFLAYVGVSP